MLGFSLEFWESVFFWSTGIAAGAGAVGVAAAFIAGMVGYQVTDRLVKESNVKISEANARAEEAKAIAAKANLELARFKAPRVLDNEQQDRIKEKLKKFIGATFVTSTLPLEPESSAFSNIIETTLTESAWVFNPNHERTVLVTSVSGVIITVGMPADAKAKEAGETLYTALTDEGIAARLMFEKLQAKPIKIDIDIKIGIKR